MARAVVLGGGGTMGGLGAGWQAEPGAEGVAQAGSGGLEEEEEEMAAFAEDAAEHFRDCEHELAVRYVVADGGGDPCAGLAGAALVAGGAEVAGLAGEGEELFMAAIGAMEAGEAGGEVAAAEEGADGGLFLSSSCSICMTEEVSAGRSIHAVAVETPVTSGRTV